MSLAKLQNYLARMGAYLARLQENPTAENLQEAERVLPLVDRATALTQKAATQSPFLKKGAAGLQGWQVEEAPTRPPTASWQEEEAPDIAEAMQELFPQQPVSGLEGRGAMPEARTWTPPAPPPVTQAAATEETPWWSPLGMAERAVRGAGKFFQYGLEHPSPIGFPGGEPFARETKVQVPAPPALQQAAPPAQPSVATAAAAVKDQPPAQVLEDVGRYALPDEQPALGRLRAMLGEAPQLFTAENLVIALFMGAPAAIGNYLKEKQVYQQRGFQVEMMGTPEAMETRQLRGLTAQLRTLNLLNAPRTRMALQQIRGVYAKYEPLISAATMTNSTDEIKSLTQQRHNELVPWLSELQRQVDEAAATLTPSAPPTPAILR